MSTNQTRLEQRRTDYLSAVERLQGALDQPFNEFIRDSVIQRFEFCFELAWKLLKLKLQSDGIEADTPREVLKQAAAASIIADANGWSAILKHRNETSHTYDENLAQTVFDFIKQTGLDLFSQLAKKASAW